MTDEQPALTKRQKAIINFIVKFTQKKGYPPTIRDIGKGVGLSSSSSVHHQLLKLEKTGLIRRDPAKPRSIIANISNQPENSEKSIKSNPGHVDENVIFLPLIESAGQLAELDKQRVIPVPRSMFNGKNGFVIPMNGESMADCGIFAGDLCIVEESDEMDEGRIHAFVAGGETGVMRVFKHMDLYRLEPENRRMTPVYVREIKILGKVTGIYRHIKE